MVTRKGGPRQPGGGRHTPGPRHQQRSRRGDASRGGRRAGPASFDRPLRRAAPDEPPKRERSTPAPAPLPTAVQTVAVTPDESGMRVDRFLEARFPGLSFSHIQRVIRKGELRVNGKRADSKDRLEEGQSVRIPPLRLDTPKAPGALSEAAKKTLDTLKAMILFEDDD